jgi:hypothetical protein
MTKGQETVRTAVVGGVIALAGSLALILLTGAWSAKENASDHKADIQAVNANIRRVLDVVCAPQPTIPQCTESSR